MSSTLKGVMIGAGFFAEFQAEAWRRMPAVEIAAIADLNGEKAEAFAGKFSLPRAYRDVEEMLDREKPDFVDIATRPEAHLQLVRLAASRGAHVICQKPMAPAWEESVEMVEVCERAKVRLLMHENWRWQPWYREAKRLIDAGTIGDLFQLTFQWRTGDGRGPEPYAVQPYFRRMPRLLVYESLVHILDTFRFFGGELARVYCRNRRVNPRIAGEDQSLIQVTFESGVPGLIDANRISGPAPGPVAMGSMLFEGDRALIRVTPEGHLRLAEYGGTERAHEFPMPRGGYKGDSVHATQVHLIESLLSGKPSESDGRDYLKTVAAVEACYRSAESGQAVELRRTE